MPYIHTYIHTYIHAYIPTYTGVVLYRPGRAEALPMFNWEMPASWYPGMYQYVWYPHPSSCPNRSCSSPDSFPVPAPAQVPAPAPAPAPVPTPAPITSPTPALALAPVPTSTSAQASVADPSSCPSSAPIPTKALSPPRLLLRPRLLPRPRLLLRPRLLPRSRLPPRRFMNGDLPTNDYGRRFANEGLQTKICDDEYLAIRRFVIQKFKICGCESLRDEITQKCETKKRHGIRNSAYRRWGSGAIIIKKAISTLTRSGPNQTPWSIDFSSIM